MSKNRLYVPILVHGQVDPFFMMSLIGLLKSDVPISRIQLYMDSLVSRSRNKSASNFLNYPDSEILLFIDADISFEPWQVQQLLNHFDDETVEVVGGVYPIKQMKFAPVLNFPSDDHPNRPIVKVKHIGTGFLMIRKTALLRMVNSDKVDSYKAYPNEKVRTDVLHNFFPIQVRGDEYLSEDWGFCELAQECGINIWVDLDVQVSHRGMVAFPLEMDEMKEAIAHNEQLNPQPNEQNNDN